ncbi:MAG: peptidylprolyl isomerase [Cyclobacteriaceae bacterium]|nr:peptidylprolyl isomerase [Cyclobacteriaceae bacterium]
MKFVRFFLLAVFLPAGYVFSQQKDRPLELFSVDNKPVDVDEFVYLYKKNHQGREEEFTKEKIEEYLTLFINFKLKVTEAESRGMGNTESFKTELNGYKAELRKPFVAEGDALDKLVKEVYDRMNEEVKASHILISINGDASPKDTLEAYNKAIEIRERVMKGEDFGMLAQEFSSDPSAKSNSGDLGYFTALQMVYPFEDAAFKTEVGKVSNPVRTRFGYHIIKVVDRRPSSGEIEVSHILVRGNENKNRIDEAYQKILRGEDWTKVCKEYSEDPGTKDNGGRLRPFGKGALASAPKFEEVAFSLRDPGAVSSPFQTSFGWHIVKLEKKIPVPPFSELEPALKRRVARDERMAISKAKEDERRKKKLNFHESEELRNKLNQLMDSTITKEGWKPANGLDMSAELFEVNSKKYSLADFATFIQKGHTATKESPTTYVNRLYETYVNSVLSNEEDIQLQRENPEYKSLVNEYREGILLFSIMEQEVWNKASNDSLGQVAYYQSHLDKYKAGDRVEARIFATHDKEFSDQVKETIAKGDTLKPEDLKKFKSITNSRAYEKGEHPAIDRVNWVIGLQEAEADGMYYLVEISSLVAPGTKKFEEVRASVISDFQDALEKKWIEALRAKYPVKVNKKGKKKALSILTSKG